MYTILHVMGGADVGGISAVVLGYFRNIDRSIFHFDLVLNSGGIGRNAREFQNEGSIIYLLPQKHMDMTGFCTGLKKILSKNHYDAIHVHQNETSYVALRIAKQMGVPCRVAHSHSTVPVNCVKDELRRLSGCFLNAFYATQLVGCGQLAGERVFGKGNMKRPIAHVLPNAIDLQRFKFSLQCRHEVRNELGLGTSTVIGLVGRLSEEKNPLFALKILDALLQSVTDVCLLYVGGGAMEVEIRQEVERLGLQNKVILTGSRDDVERIYSALDVLIMPSLYEGFPVVAVEAMASDLPIILSDNITKEFSFYSKAFYLSLTSPDSWAEKIVSIRSCNTERTSDKNEARENGFDISKTAKELEQIYLYDLI